MFLKFTVSGLTEPVTAATLRIHTDDVSGAESSNGGTFRAHEQHHLVGDGRHLEQPAGHRRRDAGLARLGVAQHLVPGRTWARCHRQRHVQHRRDVVEHQRRRLRLAGDRRHRAAAHHHHRHGSGPSPSPTVSPGARGSGPGRRGRHRRLRLPGLGHGQPARRHPRHGVHRRATTFTPTGPPRTSPTSTSPRGAGTRRAPVPRRATTTTTPAAPPVTTTTSAPAPGPSGRGYYSYDLGNWHVVSLNSEVSTSAGSAQEQWLRADLAASTQAVHVRLLAQAAVHLRLQPRAQHGGGAAGAGAV